MEAVARRTGALPRADAGPAVSEVIEGALRRELGLDLLDRALAYPGLCRRISAEAAEAVLDWLQRAATVAPDPQGPPPIRSHDRGDDYLPALAASERALLVSGDEHLVSLQGALPVYSPASCLLLLDDQKP